VDGSVIVQHEHAKGRVGLDAEQLRDVVGGATVHHEYGWDGVVVVWYVIVVTGGEGG